MHFQKFIPLLNNSKTVHKKPNLKRSTVKVMEAATDNLLVEIEVCLFVFIPFDCMLKVFPYDTKSSSSCKDTLEPTKSTTAIPNPMKH